MAVARVVAAAVSEACFLRLSQQFSNEDALAFTLDAQSLVDSFSICLRSLQNKCLGCCVLVCCLLKGSLNTVTSMVTAVALTW